MALERRAAAARRRVGGHSAAVTIFGMGKIFAAGCLLPAALAVAGAATLTWVYARLTTARWRAGLPLRFALPTDRGSRAIPGRLRAGALAAGAVRAPKSRSSSSRIALS